jgi:hypothetical protein
MFRSKCRDFFYNKIQKKLPVEKKIFIKKFRIFFNLRTFSESTNSWYSSQMSRHTEHHLEPRWKSRAHPRPRCFLKGPTWAIGDYRTLRVCWTSTEGYERGFAYCKTQLNPDPDPKPWFSRSSKSGSWSRIQPLCWTRNRSSIWRPKLRQNVRGTGYSASSFNVKFRDFRV